MNLDYDPDELDAPVAHPTPKAAAAAMRRILNGNVDAHGYLVGTVSDPRTRGMLDGRYDLSRRLLRVLDQIEAGL